MYNLLEHFEPKTAKIVGCRPGAHTERLISHAHNLQKIR